MLGPAPRIDLPAAADGYRCAVRVWQVEAPSARIILLHGIVSHGGWYLRCCRYLAGRGLEVHCLDRRGSGLNLQGRGDVNQFTTWLEDVEAYTAGLSRRLPNILLGISWGGKLAAVLAARRPQLFRATGLLFPGIYARQFPGPVKYAALRLAAAAGLAGLRVPIPLRDPGLFTNHPDWQRYIRNDPLALRSVTVRFALADRHLTREARRSAGHITVPTLLALAGRDQIVDNRRCRDFFQQIAAADKTLCQYPDAAHTLEFEDDATRYFQDLCAWIGRVA